MSTASADEPPPRTPMDDARDALYDLYFMSLEDEERDVMTNFRRQTEPEWVPSTDLGRVAATIGDGPFNRLVRVHAVARALARQPGLIADEEASLALAVAIQSAIEPDTDGGRDAELHALAAGLREFVAGLEPDITDRDTELTPALWQQFLAAVGLQREAEEVAGS